MGDDSVGHGKCEHDEPGGNTTDRDEYLKSYWEHSRTLRNWLIAFGIGAPALVFSNDNFWNSLRASGSGVTVIRLFIFGVISQVVLTSINKYAMLGCYFGEADAKYKDSWFHKFSQKASSKVGIDLALDLLSIGLFSAGTIKALLVLLTISDFSSQTQADIEKALETNPKTLGSAISVTSAPLLTGQVRSKEQKQAVEKIVRETTTVPVINHLKVKPTRIVRPHLSHSR